MTTINGVRGLGNLGVSGPGVTGFFDDVKNLITKGTEVYNQNAAILDPLRNQVVQSTVKAVLPSASSPAPQTQLPVVAPNQPAATTAKPMSTGTKVAIGVGIAAVVGTGIYVATRKSKKAA